MSDIDCVRHVRAGLFSGRPIYIALEDGNRTFGDRSMLKYNVAIGGGCGEHPALLISDPLACVAHYLDTNELVGHEIDAPGLVDLLNVDLENIFHYCDGMTREDWVTSFLADFSESGDVTFEHWVAENLGEFLYNFVRGFYPKSDEWFEINGRLDDDGGCIVTIPWGDYGGNGTNLFGLTQQPNSKNAG